MGWEATCSPQWGAAGHSMSPSLPWGAGQVEWVAHPPPRMYRALGWDDLTRHRTVEGLVLRQNCCLPAITISPSATFFFLAGSNPDASCPWPTLCS